MVGHSDAPELPIEVPKQALVGAGQSNGTTVVRVWTCRTVAFIATLVCAAIAGPRFSEKFTTHYGTLAGAPANVHRFTGALEDYDRVPPNCPSIVLLGSSQTQSVPSLVKGGPRIEEAVGTTIDQLASLWGDPHTCFDRIAMPAFLPMEMLVALGYYTAKHIPPKAVIVGITWDSLAANYYFRGFVQNMLEDGEFSKRLLTRAKELGFEPSVVRALADESRRAEEARSRRENAPIGEQLDAKVMRWATRNVPLVANLEIQAAVRRSTFERLLLLLTHGGTTNVHEASQAKLEFNLAALIALAEYLKASGVPMLAYRVPERTDVLALTDQAREERTMEELTHALVARGAVVVDLRHVVPNQYWGWAGDSPDRAHFAVPGHRLLAEALIAEGRARGVFERRGTPQ